MTIHEKCKVWMKVVIDVNTGSSDEAVKDAEYIRDLLDKEEKYRWHDLRVDAEDLPKEHKTVLFAFDWGEHHPYSHSRYEYIAGYVDGRCGWHDVDGTYQGEYPDIVAWKEIEPFETEREK